MDGKDVGHSKLLNGSIKSANFVGFVKYGDTSRIYYNQFQFAAAEVDAGKAVSTAVFQQGRISSTVDEVQVGGEDPGYRYDVAVSGPSRVGMLPEGKKVRTP